MRSSTIIRRLNKAKPRELWQIYIDDKRNWEEWKKRVEPENLDCYIPDVEYDGSTYGLCDITDEEYEKRMERDIVDYLSEKSLSCNIVECRASTKVLWVELDESKDGTTNIDADVIQAFVDYVRRAWKVEQQ